MKVKPAQKSIDCVMWWSEQGKVWVGATVGGVYNVSQAKMPDAVIRSLRDGLHFCVAWNIKKGYAAFTHCSTPTNILEKWRSARPLDKNPQICYAYKFVLNEVWSKGVKV